MGSCFNHGDREASFRCAVCGKGLCEECVIQEQGSYVCSAECRAKAASMTGRSDAVLAEKKKTDSSSLVRRLIYIFVVIAAIAAAYHFYTKHEKTVDQKLKNSLKQAEKKTSALIKETKKSVPASSRAKRERENLVK